MTQDNTQKLPATGYVRMAQIAGPIVPVCAATIWRWVRAKKFPQPVNLSERVTALPRRGDPRLARRAEGGRMNWPVDCIVCAMKLRKADDAIHATQTDEAGLTTTWSMCAPCLVRFQRDPAFAACFEKFSFILTESIEA
jgi:predicted DNA-binding transcriptional regulator AlpA